MKIKATSPETGPTEVYIDRLPDKCPLCKRGIRCELSSAHFSQTQHYLFVAVLCPFDDCGCMFTGHYSDTNDYQFSTSPEFELNNSGLLIYNNKTEFPEEITNLSPEFCKIYDQAQQAENAKLDKICGPGFRKALEFLIKDFLLNLKFKNDKDAQTKVRAATLAQCINNYIDEPRIKSTAARATWLGNDETHYDRKWSEMDIKDLKKLITMTVSWIELLVLSEDYEAKMVANSST